MRRALLVLLLLAGCASPSLPPSTTAPFDFAVELDHDHRDPALHTRAHGLDLAAFIDAKELLGDEDARLSDFQVQGDLAAVTVNGRAGASSGGFLTLYMGDPAHPKVLGRYRSGSEDNWYTKFNDAGVPYIFLTANGNTEASSAAGALEEDLRTATATGPARGIHVVRIGDPAHPMLASVYPVPVRVVNLAYWVGRDGTQWLFASIIGDRAARPLIGGEASQLNYVAVLRFDPARGILEEAARWSPDDSVAGQAFPHDLSVARHPLVDKDVLYAAYWDAGGYLVDVTDPTRPVTLGRVPALGATDHVHTFKPHPGLIDGRALAVLAPETFGAEPTGTYRALDVGDPTTPHEVARWTLPGEPKNPEPLLWSPHEFSLSGGRLYASQYHGGAWILALPDLKPVAVWQRSIGDPARTNDWAVDIETLVPHGDYVYAVDMGSGVLVFRQHD